MRKGFLCLVSAVLAGAGMARAEAPVAAPSAGGSPDVVQSLPPTVPAGDKYGPGLAGGPQCLGGSCCEAPCVEEKAPCGPPGRFWVNAEYLLFWFKNSHIPPLVTTSPLASGGVLGAPGTTILSGGGGSLNSGPYSGGRFTAGFWLNDCQTCGLEAGYFFLGSRTSNFTAGSSGAPGTLLLARPFTNAITGAPGAEIVAAPLALAGTVNASSRSSLQGAPVNMVHNLCCGCWGRFDVLAGFNWMRLDETLTVTESILVLPGINPALGFPFVPGNTITVVDQFHTRNNFYGGQVGARLWWWRDRLFANATGLVALGNNHQQVDITGSTSVTTPAGATTVLPGGLLALPTNIGSYSRDRFSVIPQVGMNVGYQLTDYVRAYVGYNLIYWTNVVRPGDQIDPVLNPTRTPTSVPFGAAPTGPARPAFTFQDSDFWAQGISFGMQFNF